jgi:hypothetical protein
MTAIQMCALIGLIIGAALLYWTGYRGGLINGRIEGVDEGKAIQHSDNSEVIRSLEHSLLQMRADRRQLYGHYERALAASKFGEQEREILIAIAEKLRIAAETFSAFRTGKKLERDTRTLHVQALTIAALLEPAKLEGAA